VEGALFEGAREPGLRLIETMLWDGGAFPRLALHLARLQDSARRLGWPCDPKAAVSALREAVSTQCRVRLTLDRHGVLRIETAKLPPAKPLWHLGLASETLRSGDAWLTLKSTRRAAYDRARASLPAGIDEAIFLNERGEVCDGSITTLFFDRGQGMRTPPLTSGLLPGVLRAELACPEEVLHASDLAAVRLWVGNALRGLAPAIWTGSATAGSTTAGAA
jgi:4-amino-4-deoxychorismate lyase